MSKQTPHDNFFRASFGRVEIAQNYLQEYAPADLVTQLDLSEMTLVEGTFVDEEMDRQQSDVLYATRLANGEPAYVYFLFEHKSYPDPEVAFQLLRYQVRIWESQMKNDKRLSPIVPLVLYHGTRSWNVPTDFASLLIRDTPQAERFRQYLPQFEYQFRDFSHLSDEEIRGKIWLRAALETFHAILDPKLHDRLPRLIQLLSALEEERTGLEYLKQVLYYLTEATEKVSRKQLRQVLLAQSQQGEKLMGTIAQEYIREGIELGIEQGIEKGIEQGIEQGEARGLQKELQTMRESIAEIMAVRLNMPEETYAATLAMITERETLRKLLLLASTAVSPTEFEAGLPQGHTN